MVFAGDGSLFAFGGDRVHSRTVTPALPQGLVHYPIATLQFKDF